MNSVDAAFSLNTKRSLELNWRLPSRILAAGSASNKPPTTVWSRGARTELSCSQAKTERVPNSNAPEPNHLTLLPQPNRTQTMLWCSDTWTNTFNCHTSTEPQLDLMLPWLSHNNYYLNGTFEWLTFDPACRFLSTIYYLFILFISSHSTSVDNNASRS